MNEYNHEDIQGRDDNCRCLQDIISCYLVKNVPTFCVNSFPLTSEYK